MGLGGSYGVGGVLQVNLWGKGGPMGESVGLEGFCR